VLATLRRRLREEVVPALTVVLISLELTDNRNRLQAPAVLRLRGAVLRLRGAVLRLRTASGRPPAEAPLGRRRQRERPLPG
jgi:hypothetical protein